MVKKVLVVDDSKTMRDMVTFTLKSEGYDVLEANDGVHALSVLGSGVTDLVITDINMPNMDGITLVSELRAKPAFRSVPILILTTESGSEIKSKGKSAGATGWIVKPFVPEKLIGVVQKVCPI